MSGKYFTQETKRYILGWRVECGVIQDRKKGRSFLTFTLAFRVIRNEERENNFQGILEQ